MQHFLSLLDLDTAALEGLVQRAIVLKRLRRQGNSAEPLAGKTLGMIFEKASTRTRVSFEAGMIQLGGHAMFLSPRDMQLGRGEPVTDTARVLSRMVDGILIRTFSHQTLETFAAASEVPVINGLSDRLHPCQLLADIQTFVEHRGAIRGRRIAFVGDANNMCRSYVNAARRFEFTLHVASPPGFDLDAETLQAADDWVRTFTDPFAAVRGCDAVVTDVWASMGQEAEQDARVTAFDGFQVTEAMMAEAGPEAVFLHCLPAHRGEEVAAEVIDGPRSLVWDEAENRLHSQKALLEYLLG